MPTRYSPKACHTKVMAFLCLTLVFSFNLIAQPNLTFDVEVSSGLNLPVEVVNASDGSNRLFIVEKGGVVKIYNGTSLVSTPFLDISDSISTDGERGLLSMAFHPLYENNGYFFVYYTDNDDGSLRLVRFNVSGDPNIADEASGKILISIPHASASNHNGGHLQFGTDGKLYFGTGDGGNTPQTAQDGTSLLGKMIRLDVDVVSSPYYSIPSDNPFFGDDGIRDEIWAFGLRNPFRWSFDRLTGDMWLADVGQNAWEEINRLTLANSKGVNYGWNCFEGNHVFSGCTPSGTYAPPILEYPHDDLAGGLSVTGGYVYRGSSYPAINNHYIFADFVSGNVWLLPFGGSAPDTIKYLDLMPSISSFGEAENGELYATTLNPGVLYSVKALIVTPVKLANFLAIPNSGAIELTWQILEEQNVLQYEIEFSTTGTNFQRVGIVPANNSSTYRFSHTHSTGTKLYYRLRMVDNDSRFEYSKIIQVNASAAKGANFVRPSLINSRVLNLLINEPFDEIQLISIEGKTVWRQSTNGRTGNMSFSLPALLPGNYLVRLLSNERIITQKVFIR